MKRIKLVTFLFFIVLNLHAEESIQTQMQNVDKLDVLDKQSKEFFNAITGLEKNYLEEQVSAIKNKKDISPNVNSQQVQTIIKEEPKLSQEDYEKYVFTHQNDMARLTTDFTRTKKLKDLKIKSMYSFNGKDYVLLKLEDENSTKKTQNGELSANIEGRYIVGDSILEHRIISINTRTKSVELYKKLDEEYGYTIYLSNYGISVSDLKKIPKVEEKIDSQKSLKKDDIKAIIKEETSIKKVFSQVPTKNETKLPLAKSSSTENLECLYTVKIANLNVRNSNNLNGRILRILKQNDQFTVKQKQSDWVQLDTIYKNKSGDVMLVANENNWLQIIDNNVNATDSNCM
jgi:LysM repeat protein